MVYLFVTFVCNFPAPIQIINRGTIILLTVNISNLRSQIKIWSGLYFNKKYIFRTKSTLTKAIIRRDHVQTI